MRSFRLVALLALAAAPLAAQGNALYPESSAATGVQFRSYHFGAGAQYTDISQFAIPIAVMLPVNKRFAVDIGSYYASTSATLGTGGKQTLSGLTDVQVRGAYVFGNNAMVASLVLNLPTGAKFDTAQAAAAGASASNWLLFPVNSFANGFSATGGLAATTHAGQWNLGAAVSGRVNSSYQPVKDLSSSSYKPGIEGRLRLGADRLVGQARLTFGLTLSTFGDDTFGSGFGGPTSYRPGNRVIGEASYTVPGLGGMITAYAWDFLRASGKDTASAANRENIFTAGASHRIPLSRTASLESIVEGRFLSQQSGGSGALVGIGTGLRMQLNERFSLVPAVRGDFGSAKFPTGGSANVTGLSASALLRYNF
jgi:hypothetical protein